MTDKQNRDWRRLAGDLRAFRDSKKEAWGNLDEEVIARYVAGECTPQERADVVQVINQREDVRESVEMLQDVMNAPGLIAEASLGDFLQSTWKRSSAGMTQLAERLRSWVDETGRSVAAGLADCVERPRFVYGHMSDASTAGLDTGHVWEIPISETGKWLAISVRPGHAGDEWLVGFRPHDQQGESLLETTSVGIRSEAGKTVFSGPLHLHGEVPFTLSNGIWQLEIEMATDIRLVELAIGEADLAPGD